ncbi:hypothetical protein [Bacteroides helcogenes]|uniref:hypothetical protein n=1 Tax=Bacteroides helcogenes TaxID=290053 RepID=UPI0002F8F64B|nr:hypothetical protein [Bacteroides helcogenes]MDY5237725.1 hypothetical protein [Bacteroides helcogenes]
MRAEAKANAYPQTPAAIPLQREYSAGELVAGGWRQASFIAPRQVLSTARSGRAPTRSGHPAT